MPSIFSWAVDDGPTGNSQFRVKRVRFGDGYEQRAADGLHNRTQTWSISKRGPWSELDPIEQFLIDHAGHTSFYWTPPGPNAAQGLYVCESFSFSPRSGEYGQLNATFTEVHYP